MDKLLNKLMQLKGYCAVRCGDCRNCIYEKNGCRIIGVIDYLKKTKPCEWEKEVIASLLNP